ncbi:hypothetical protein EMIHUDRAFT_108014 [Emiliania huxleyi CCMP1516]|uniref:Guanine nucleotide-binding protein-like 3 N-terminal domain-containing protein n=2 Tax=Emiliania huxleyi TaxID=2903 RepID=A0A0D3HY07_EMIH1|nr:hypothetical protein EMIHUDRAFT_108014 [Emiliania huxleyi CCMP1516]EOD03892.1 hypothetical protein EMIHUDRAFT_108014 [Emiliania huxleyi CCMP1516]|eukprot:XP_005756321.1 hypothetical protein EMIHUDRAFT_108014 [Emiliania huxleyi CCMP1516]
MGGCNIDTAFSRADSDFSMSLLKNWRTLVAHNPDFALDEGGASKYPAIAAAIATYESTLSDWKEVAPGGTGGRRGPPTGCALLVLLLLTKGTATGAVQAALNDHMVLKSRKTKRTTLHDKHKIERKVREHHRKQRRDARRGVGKAGRKKKDPGIPASWPFKAQLIAEQQAQREAQLAAQAAAREFKRAERAAAKRAEEAAAAASHEAARERRTAKRRAAAFSPLHEVLADAGLVLILLDARDPAACRCEPLEAALRDCGKPYLLVLSRADAAGAAAGTLRVGVVGFDGVGKRALLRVVRAQAERGGGALDWLDRPARLQSLAGSLGVNDLLLRRAPAEALPQPLLSVGSIVERCARRPLLRHLQIASFTDEADFVSRYAARVGAADNDAAALAARSLLCAAALSCCDGAAEAELGGVCAAAEGFVVLTAGEPEEIDLSVEEEEWGAGDIGEAGEESGEEGEEEESEEEEEDSGEEEDMEDDDEE